MASVPHLITGDGTKSYTYDSLRRLLSATPTSTGNTESYTYDKTGNRKTDLQSTYTTNSLDQYTTITGATNTTYTYDNNGNIKTDGSRTYTYDYQNRLIQVTQSGTTLVSYQYDPLGRRIQKSTPSETIRYTYAGDNILQEKKSIGSLTLKKVYINGLGTDILIAYEVDEIPNQEKLSFCNARVLPYSADFTSYGYSTIVSDCTTTINSSTGITTNRYYYHTNHLGSIIALSNSSGAVLQKYAYDSFGKPYIISGSGTLVDLSSYAGNLYSNTRLYTGREYDKEIKLYFLRARYYDPQIGRFISRDPIGQNDQINLYTYVANSPMNYVDRMGREKVLIISAGDLRDSTGLVGALSHYNKKLLREVGYKSENIHEKSITNIDQLSEIFREINNGGINYKKIIIQAHGSKESIFLGYGEGGELNTETLKQLQMSPNFNTLVQIDACQVGAGENSIGEALARQLGTTVMAPDNYLNLNYDPATGEGQKQVQGFLFSYLKDTEVVNFYHNSIKTSFIGEIPVIEEMVGGGGYRTFKY